MALVASTGACARVAGRFTCDESSQCVQGSVAGACEPTGFCSFPDPLCPSGRRYAVHASADLAGGTTFETRAEIATPFDVSAVHVVFGGGTYPPEAAPGMAVFDDLNGGTASGTECPTVAL